MTRSRLSVRNRTDPSPITKFAPPLWLEVNGTSRQRGDLSQLIWKIPEMIAYLSTLFTLAPGDLIFTGTPSGVGPIDRGDVLKGGVDGVGTLTVRVV